MKMFNRLMQPILFSLFLFMSISVWADNTVQYSYDAAGNRTSLHPFVLRNGNGSEDDTNPARHDLKLHSITLYPNPTEGQFKIEITGTDTFDEASIVIYNISGTLIYSNTDPGAVNDIDLSSYPDGMYLLRIRVDGETSNWKVIKI